MPTPNSKYPSPEQLLNSLLTAFTCTAVSSIIFTATFIPAPVLVFVLIAPLINASTSVSLSFTSALAYTIGPALGAAFGLVCAFLGLAIVGNYSPHVSAAFAFPVSYLLASVEAPSSPLRPLLRPDAAAITLYGVAAFSLGNPKAVAWYLVTVFSIGAAGGLAASLLFRVLSRGRFSSTNKLLLVGRKFLHEISDFAETFSLGATRGPQCRPLLLKRAEFFQRAFNDLQTGVAAVRFSKVDYFPSESIDLIANLATVISAQTLALLETVTFPYTEIVERVLWRNIQKSFDDLIAEISRCGRKIENVDVERHCNCVHDKLVNLNFAGIESEISDCLRFSFCLLTCVRLGRLVHSLAAVIGNLEHQRVKFPWRQGANQLATVVRNLFDIKQWKSSLTHDPGLYLKQAVIFQAVTQVILVWHLAQPAGIARNGIWVIIPLFYILQPTFGSSLRKGVRGFIAVGVGGGLGITSIVLTDSDDMLAYYLQVFLVVFLAVLLSFIPIVEFASFDAAITWIIVALANWQMTISDSTRVKFATDRIILTCIGAGAAVMSGLILFPRFSVHKYRHACAQGIRDSAKLFDFAVEFSTSSQSVSPHPENVTTGQMIFNYHANAAFEATDCLRQHQTNRQLSRDDAAAEVAALDSVSLSLRRSQSTIPTRKLFLLEATILDIENAAVVVFATAAAALTSASTHEHAFTPALTAALQLVSREVIEISFTLVECISRPVQVELSGMSDLSSIASLESETIGLANKLAHMDLLNELTNEGILRVFALFYSLSYFVEKYRALAQFVQGRPPGRPPESRVLFGSPNLSSSCVVLCNCRVKRKRFD